MLLGVSIIVSGEKSAYSLCKYAYSGTTRQQRFKLRQGVGNPDFWLLWVSDGVFSGLYRQAVMHEMSTETTVCRLYAFLWVFIVKSCGKLRIVAIKNGLSFCAQSVLA